jgi:hypothetical protein
MMKRFFMAVGLIFCSVYLVQTKFVLETAAAESQWKVLFDSSPVKGSVAKLKNVPSRLGEDAKQLARKLKNCSGNSISEFSPSGKAIGPFTRSSRTEEIAYLVAICEIHDWLTYAILIYDGPHLVKKMILETSGAYASVNEIYAVRDLNQNGLREIAIVSSYGDGGFFAQELMLLEHKNGVFRNIGGFSVGLFSGGTETKNKIYVFKSKKPRFMQDIYFTPDELNAKTSIRKMVPVQIGSAKIFEVINR